MNLLSELTRQHLRGAIFDLKRAIDELRQARMFVLSSKVGSAHDNAVALLASIEKMLADDQKEREG